MCLPLKHSVLFSVNVKQHIDIVIHQSDKWGAVVILNLNDYKQEVLHQLNESNTYHLLDSDPTLTFKQKLGQLLELGKGMEVLSPKTAKYLMVDNHINPCIPSPFQNPQEGHSCKGPPHCGCVGSIFRILSGKCKILCSSAQNPNGQAYI